MERDAVCVMGRSHTLCQDYARTGCRPPLPLREGAGGGVGLTYALVSDGCSGSEDSDVGARLLTLAAEKSCASAADASAQCAAFSADVIGTAFESAQRLGLGRHSLDATLLMLSVAPSPYPLPQGEGGTTARVQAFGDGVLGLRKKDSLRLLVLSTPSGYPPYLSYLLDEAADTAFRQRGGGGKLAAKWLRVTDGGAVVERETEYDRSFADTWTIEPDDVAFVASDGLCSFRRSENTATSRGSEAVPVEQVAWELTSFRSLKGKFVERRAKAFLKDCEKRGWYNYDDVALAAVAV